MDLNLILKICLTIIVCILTLIFAFAFVEAIVRKIQEPKRKKKELEALDKFTEEFIKWCAKAAEDNVTKAAEKLDNAKKKTTRKTTKKKED